MKAWLCLSESGWPRFKDFQDWGDERVLSELRFLCLNQDGQDYRIYRRVGIWKQGWNRGG